MTQIDSNTAYCTIHYEGYDSPLYTYVLEIFIPAKDGLLEFPYLKPGTSFLGEFLHENWGLKSTDGYHRYLPHEITGADQEISESLAEFTGKTLIAKLEDILTPDEAQSSRKITVNRKILNQFSL